MTLAQKNHLRRLLGWLRCEVGQTPEEQRETMRSIAHALTEYPDEAAQDRLMESYDRAASIPKYVRAAIKALQPLTAEAEGVTVDMERTKRLASPYRCPECASERAVHKAGCSRDIGATHQRDAVLGKSSDNDGHSARKSEESIHGIAPTISTPAVSVEKT